MGQLVFQATLGGAINLAGPNTASTVTFTLPSADGSSGQVLQTNGAGLLSLGNVALGSAVSGTLPVGNGGTGVTTTPTNGQLLIGNGTNYTVASLGSGTGISTTTGSGTLTINNTGVTSAVAGTGITVSGATGAVTISIPQAITTTSNVQFGSFGVGTAASGTTGEIRATNNVTAYYSSDIKFKENIHDVPNALEIVCAIGSKIFDWKDEYLVEHGGEDGYFIRKSDFGVIAQDVEKVFSRAVRTREDGSLAVDYEKLSILSFGAIGQLLKRVEALESK